MDAANAMARGVRAAIAGARCVLMPIADGGDGLIDALRVAFGGDLVSASVRGPLGERRRASYLWIVARRTAVIEMARASGLALVPVFRRDPLRATSRGTGDLIRDAVRRGARTVIVGMGGSASNDGGAGMARALGARLLDAQGRELPEGAAALSRLARVDARAVRTLLSGVRVVALSDVANPLLGRDGSARVFGPQKGASVLQVRLLEKALTRWAQVLSRDLGVRTARVPGAGAAGGLGSGLLAFARAEIVPGADWVLDRVGARTEIKRAALVLTGEGRLDGTSLFGKAPIALARRAKTADVPCAAVAGQVEDAARSALRRAGLMRIVSFSQAGAGRLSDAMKRSAHWAAKAAAKAVAGMAVFLVVAAASDRAIGEGMPLPSAIARSDDLYFHRDRPGNLDENIKALDGLQAGGPHPACLWRRCRALVRRGEKKERKSDRLADYDLARKDCGKSVALSSADAEAHFWLGVAMGRWGETKGIMKALFMIKPIRREMAETLKLDANHGGAHHVLGEILWQLPGFAGGDKKKALAEFETAVRLSPNYTSNHQSLAEAYLHFKREEDAIRVLLAVEAVKEPADPAEYPDNLADARKLLARLDAVGSSSHR